jgi:hypothetical protein
MPWRIPPSLGPHESLGVDAIIVCTEPCVIRPSIQPSTQQHERLWYKTERVTMVETGAAAQPAPGTPGGMSHTVLGCQVSKMVNRDTCPRATTGRARSHCRFVLLLVHVIYSTDALRDSVPPFWNARATEPYGYARGRRVINLQPVPLTARHYASVAA